MKIFDLYDVLPLKTDITPKVRVILQEGKVKNVKRDETPQEIRDLVRMTIELENKMNQKSFMPTLSDIDQMSSSATKVTGPIHLAQNRKPFYPRYQIKQIGAPFNKDVGRNKSSQLRHGEYW